MIVAALVGLDGAGKTTVGRALEDRLPVPARYVYMGVNPAAATISLPTTRLVHARRVRRGTFSPGPVVTDEPEAVPGNPVRRALRSARAVAGTANQLVEEAYRDLVVRRSVRRGVAIILDRHLAADFATADRPARRESRVRRAHNWVRAHAFREPDLLVLLDAPAEVVFARKGEGTVEWLDRRRSAYLRYLEGAGVPAAVVDATQPVDAVVDEVVKVVAAAIEDRVGARARAHRDRH